MIEFLPQHHSLPISLPLTLRSCGICDVAENTFLSFTLGLKRWSKRSLKIIDCIWPAPRLPNRKLKSLSTLSVVVGLFIVIGFWILTKWPFYCRITSLCNAPTSFDNSHFQVCQLICPDLEIIITIKFPKS